MILDVCILAIGFLFLIKGADILVDGASGIAKMFGIPEIIIGLTIVSIGTSVPELMVSLTSSIQGHTEFAIGNVVGSNISNLFLILGSCATVRQLIFKDETVRLEMPIVIFSTALLFILGNNDSYIGRYDGVILLIFFILFIIYNVYLVRREQKRITINSENDEKKEKLKSIDSKQIFKDLLKILVSVIVLKYGGDFVVNSASNIATRFRISEKIISLTIVAISTSLPELVTSIIATIKNQIDMAIGNVIGSNIFNTLLIIGTVSVISPISYNLEYNRDIIIFMIGMIILQLLPFIGIKNRVSRMNGVLFLVFYVIYLTNLVYVNK